ncbi:hypothetical protein KM043_000801 [Ampulex compressa]|nr:hypothetical protein KM043_000801 [Ampulex compressa]
MLAPAASIQLQRDTGGTGEDAASFTLLTYRAAYNIVTSIVYSFFHHLRDKSRPFRKFSHYGTLQKNMSPGVNDGPRNTGTLPKSNRRNDRNRERSAANQQFANRPVYRGHAQHSNNLFQLDWQPVSERDSVRITKNSNTRSAPSAPSTSYQDISEFVLHGCGSQHNYSAEEFTNWQKMVPPTDPQSQSPPRTQGTKPSNVDKKPNRSQVESRLNQIRDYIRVTSTMMDSLNQSNDPRAQAQNEKLGRMVEDLCDSERKLSKLLEDYINLGISDESCENGREEVDENGDVSREAHLRKKMEESQRKLAQLQEHQANLQENQNTDALTWEGANPLPMPLPTNVEQLESETAVLRGKLAQLQTKKKNIDHLLAELQAAEISDHGSCSSEGSRNVGRDKAAELEAMKAQLVHLKALMDEATRVRESLDSTSEPEPDMDINGDGADDVEPNEYDNGVNISFERQSDSDDMGHGKMSNANKRPTVEEVQAVTRELKEQSALLQATRAEVQRLKQSSLSTIHSNSTSILPASTPPPSLIAVGGPEKKLSNNVYTEAQPTQGKRRQLEELIPKEQGQSSSVNRDIAGQDLNSQKSSSSQISHTSTPGNIWPAAAIISGSNEPSVDGISSSENLLDTGPQAVANESGFNAPNWWTCPPPPMNQIQHGSAEYYRQLLLGSQAQQLQMMGTTIQQCCQLLWSQKRELESLRSALTQLLMHMRQLHAPQRVSNIENQEEYSNLSRTIHHLGDTLDAALPPSSSLPNLVSLPNSSPALSHTVVVTSANSQHQHQQLNNQVPPGNRANNYWDNFRSYSRQNLLSGNVKTITDTTPGAMANSASSANTSGSSVHSSHAKDKRNREQGTDNISLPSLTGADIQYSLNLQLQSNLQQHERENTAVRSNILTNEVSQQDNLWEEAHTSFRLPSSTNDEHSLHSLSTEMKEVLSSLISVNKRRSDYLIIILREIKAISEDHKLRPHLLRSLRALQDTQSLSNPLNETTDQTASESCQSSDEDSEMGAKPALNSENQSSLAEMVESSQAGTSSSPMVQVPLTDHPEIAGNFSIECPNTLPSTSTSRPGYNEDLAEADQSRPESSGNHQLSNKEDDRDEGQEEAAFHAAAIQGNSDAEMDLDTELDIALDKIPTRLYHH